MKKFKDVHFMSAKEKELVLKAWERFLKNGLRWQDFTDRLYNHLIQHCSFIAHYNRQGFYSTYFEIPEKSIRFLRQFDKNNNGVSTEYGGSWWLSGEYEDINSAMVEAANKHLAGLYKKLSEAQKERDLAEAKRLMAKHGEEAL